MYDIPPFKQSQELLQYKVFGLISLRGSMCSLCESILGLWLDIYKIFSDSPNFALF